MGQQDRPEKRTTRMVSAVLTDGTLLELVHDGPTASTALAAYRDGRWTIEPSVPVGSSERFLPFSPRNNLISTGAVLLPSGPHEYGDQRRLEGDIAAFIHRYADISPDFERVCVAYVLFTWVYDAFAEVPYLRFRGDFGTGKTRTLQTIGSICYKPFFASGASTVSPIFHTLDAFRGTLVFDEADFRFSDERAEIVKILNNGTVRGMPVLRTMATPQREFNPRAFQVFGPKIVATRGGYEDKGLESRFLSEHMGTRKLREGVPINLPPSFASEALELRNKLLLYRFRNREQMRLRAELHDPLLEPRFNQMLLPLLSVVSSESIRQALRARAHAAQAELRADRGLLVEAQVLEALAGLMTADPSVVKIADITLVMAERHGADYARPITNRWIGSIVRKRLGLLPYKSHGTYALTIGRAELAILCGRYGVEIEAAGSDT